MSLLADLDLLRVYQCHANQQRDGQFVLSGVVVAAKQNYPVMS